MTKTWRVGICGSYGGMNLGDEAILQGILAQLRRSLDAEVTVFSRNAEDTQSRHGVRSVPARRLSREEVLPEVKRLDLLILGGGGILFDSEARAFLREAMLAHELGIPVMVYAVSAGPLEDPAAQRLVCECLERAAVVTVREREARHILEEAGLKRDVLVTADPALLLEPEPVSEEMLKREGLDGGERRRIGISVREPGGAAPDLSEDVYHALLANAADYMVERFDSDVFLVPLERQVLDLQHSHAVVSRMLRAERAHVLRGEYTPGQLLSVVGRFDFAVGMRLHFLIFAALQGVPFVALPYASKVRGFLADLDMESPPLKLVNAGRLIAYVDEAWDRRLDLTHRVRERLPALRERATRNHELLMGLVDRLANGVVGGDLRRGLDDSLDAGLSSVL